MLRYLIIWSYKYGSDDLTQISRIIWSTFPYYMNHMVILYMLNYHNKWSILYGHDLWSILNGHNMWSILYGHNM